MKFDHSNESKKYDLKRFFECEWPNWHVSVIITINQGIAIGEARGEAKGVEIGATNKVVEIARRMLKEKTDINFISSVTGLASDEVLKLQNKM